MATNTSSIEALFTKLVSIPKSSEEPFQFTVLSVTPFEHDTCSIVVPSLYTMKDQKIPREYIFMQYPDEYIKST